MSELITTADALDYEFSVRDLLVLIGHVRGTKPRDGLRSLEDALLDLCERAGA
jgi:hypothetical protein